MEIWDAKLSEAVAGVEHIVALGVRRIHLHSAPYPWEHVSRVEALDRPTLGTSPHLRFRANHPCGLILDWTLNLVEQQNSSGYEWTFNSENARMFRELPSEHVATVKAFAGTLAKSIRDDLERYRWSRADTLALAEEIQELANN